MIAFDFMPALPEIALLAAACAILLIDLFVTDARRHVTYWLTQLALLLSAWLTLALFHPQRVRADHLFANMFVADTLSDLLKLVIYGTVSLTLRSLTRAPTGSWRLAYLGVLIAQRWFRFRYLRALH